QHYLDQPTPDSQTANNEALHRQFQGERPFNFESRRSYQAIPAYENGCSLGAFDLPGSRLGVGQAYFVSLTEENGLSETMNTGTTGGPAAPYPLSFTPSFGVSLGYNHTNRLIFDREEASPTTGEVAEHRQQHHMLQFDHPLFRPTSGSPPSTPSSLALPPVPRGLQASVSSTASASFDLQLPTQFICSSYPHQQPQQQQPQQQQMVQPQLPTAYCSLSGLAPISRQDSLCAECKNQLASTGRLEPGNGLACTCGYNGEMASQSLLNAAEWMRVYNCLSLLVHELYFLSSV
ncbi:unnamed protein product, partial [Protopolystoma xenopodis]